MSDYVKLVECPRDAWQGLKGQIPADLKTNYLQALISAGFKHIDAVSFVSPNAVPQMADSEEVLKELDPPDDVEIIGIVVNEKGAQRAIATDAVRTLGFPYSISPTFLENNQRQTLEDAIEELEKIDKKAAEAGLETVVYISMAFGNPYDDPWSIDEVVEAVGLLIERATFLIPAKLVSQEGGKALILGMLGYPPGIGFAVGFLRRIKEMVWVLLGLLSLMIHRTITQSHADSERRAIAAGAGSPDSAMKMQRVQGEQSL